jgi:hypothetical protein
LPLSRGAVNLRKQANVVDYIRASTCTVQLWDGQFCDAPSWDDAPFPICIRHLTAAYRSVRSHMKELHDLDPMFSRFIGVGGLDEPLGIKTPPKIQKFGQVYYVQVGHLLKIGYTENLRRRLNQYPPNRRLLAVEEGLVGVESKRLLQFAPYLEAGKEWFRPAPELLEHVNKLRRKAGAKPIVKFMPDVA